MDETNRISQSRDSCVDGLTTRVNKNNELFRWLRQKRKNIFTFTLKLCPILVPISSSSIWSMYLLSPFKVSIPVDVPSSCSSSLSSLLSSSRSSESNSSSLFPVQKNGSARCGRNVGGVYKKCSSPYFPPNSLSSALAMEFGSK